MQAGTKHSSKNCLLQNLQKSFGRATIQLNSNKGEIENDPTIDQKCSAFDYRELALGCLGPKPEIKTSDGLDYLSVGGIEIKPEHKWLNGLYMRSIKIPPNTGIMGYKHSKDHVLIVGNGTANIDGTNVRAGDTFACRAGSRRTIVAGPEGCELGTVHPNPDNETEIPILNKRYVE